MTAKRVCTEQGCITLLTSYNISDKCFVHDIDKDPNVGSYIGPTVSEFMFDVRFPETEPPAPSVIQVPPVARSMARIACPACGVVCAGVRGLTAHAHQQHRAKVEVAA